MGVGEELILGRLCGKVEEGNDMLGTSLGVESTALGKAAGTQSCYSFATKASTSFV